MPNFASAPTVAGADVEGPGSDMRGAETEMPSLLAEVRAWLPVRLGRVALLVRGVAVGGEHAQDGDQHADRRLPAGEDTGRGGQRYRQYHGEQRVIVGRLGRTGSELTLIGVTLITAPHF